MEVTHLPSPPLRATGRVPSGTGICCRFSTEGHVSRKPLGPRKTRTVGHLPHPTRFSHPLKVWPPHLAVGTPLPPSLASLTVESGVEMALGSA